MTARVLLLRRWQAFLLAGCSLLVTHRSASTETSGRAAFVTTAAPRSDSPVELAAPSAPPASLQPMSRVPAGSYRPFYRAPGATPDLQVPEFWLDTAPVSRASFAAFVSARPGWRRSRVEPLFAERQYLADWVSDLDPGPDAGVRAVEQVSWFAAKAYCDWQGKRLPSVAEWERARGSAASSTADAAGATAVPSLWEWTLDFNSLPVGSGTNDDAGASNLFCGAGARARDARDYTTFLRYAFRSSLKANYTLKRLGLRCAKGAWP